MKDAPIAPWSGGTTTELLIYPEDSTFKNRDFDIRISYATVDAEASSFTPFPKTNRTLTVLSGNHSLSFNNQEYVELDPLSPTIFSGEDVVESRGRSVNFNVMAAEGIKYTVEVIHVSDSLTELTCPESKHCFYFLVDGEIELIEKLPPGNCILTNQTFTVKMSKAATLIKVGF